MKVSELLQRLQKRKGRLYRRGYNDRRRSMCGVVAMKIEKTKYEPTKIELILNLDEARALSCIIGHTNEHDNIHLRGLTREQATFIRELFGELPRHIYPGEEYE